MKNSDLKILNQCVKKNIEKNFYNIKRPKNLILPLNYDSIKDDLQVLEFCLECLSVELEYDKESEPTEYGLKVEKVLTLINSQIIEIKERTNKKSILKNLLFKTKSEQKK